MVDSEMFLKELDKLYDGTNIVKALNSAMGLFTGPFAFLVYSKLENKYFVVRGVSKKLHFAKIKIGNQRGFVINTEADDLVKSLETTAKLLKLMNISLTFEAPLLIAEKSISEVSIERNVLVPVGTIEENKVEIATSTTWEDEDNRVITLDKDIIGEIFKFATLADMTLHELDCLVYHIYGNGLAYISEKEYKEFATLYIPILKKECSEKKRAAFSQLYKLSNYTDMVSLLNRHSLQFPYFLNTLPRIVRAYGFYSAEKKPEQIDIPAVKEN